MHMVDVNLCSRHQTTFQHLKIMLQVNNNVVVLVTKRVTYKFIEHIRTTTTFMNRFFFMYGILLVFVSSFKVI